MTSWFVSTTRPLPESEGDVEWLLTACATEEEAKEHASKALGRGMRIEAGTIPGYRAAGQDRLARIASLGAIVQWAGDHGPFAEAPRIRGLSVGANKTDAGAGRQWEVFAPRGRRLSPRKILDVAQRTSAIAATRDRDEDSSPLWLVSAGVGQSR